MRGQDCGPRGQRALDAECGRRRATADRQMRMLLITAHCMRPMEYRKLVPCHPLLFYYYFRMEQEERTIIGLGPTI
jgi:hypothetical protein